MTALISLVDTRRLQKVAAFGAVARARKHQLRALAKMAAFIAKAPSAFVNFVDERKTRCKAEWGAHAIGIDADILHSESLCADAVLHNEHLMINDARVDPRFRHHPEVRDRAIVFYTGVVLKTSDGQAIGTLCVKDRHAHSLDEEALAMLVSLAQQVVDALEQALALAQSEEKADHDREQFLAMLAHELRAPLAPILTAVQILNHADHSIDQRNWAKDLISRHVQYMGDIVNHLLRATVVTSGALQLDLEPISLASLVSRAIELNEKLMAERRHDFTLHLEGEPWVMADRVQCPLILSNLLSNAAKYTPEGGTIRLTSFQDGAEVMVRVSDDGNGVDARDIERIFEVFGQSEQPIDREAGGIGLGLPVSRRLAEWHGGTLVGHSAGPGEGSEFVLTLRQTPAPVSLADARAMSDGPLGRPAGAMAALDILIVEDSTDVADALGLYYQMSGHKIRIAYSAQEALRSFKERAPDVMLSDIGLPGIDGYTLVRELRQRYDTGKTRFVAISGYASEHDRAASRSAGFFAHFAKPVDLAQLDALLGGLAINDPLDDSPPEPAP